jgi:hypothetical protein
MKIRKTGDDSYQHKTELMQIDIDFIPSNNGDPCAWLVTVQTMADQHRHEDDTLQGAISFAREMWSNLIGREFE